MALHQAFPRFRSYYWQEGYPVGVELVEETASKSFRIVHDSYHKHVSIEIYLMGVLSGVAYDSILYDFRDLQIEAKQTAWRKELVDETRDTQRCLLFDEVDRARLVESYSFENGLCRTCEWSSPHGVFLAKQRLFYKSMGDSLNGVILYDSEEMPVMAKRYEVGAEGDFTQQLDSVWSFAELPAWLP